MRMFLKRERSHLWSPGPITAPRGALPGRLDPVGTNAKAEVLNHWLTACGALALGSPTKLGRPPAKLFGSRRPSPAGSLEAVTVRGRPEKAYTMPETSHPPRRCPSTPCCACSQGNS